MTFGDLFARLLRLGSAGQTRIRTGTATPEGAITGAIGDLFLRTDGGAGTTLYSKTSGSGNTGWTAVGGAAAGTVTTTGSPANGNLTKFSGAASVTNADLTGDVTTSGGVAATIAAAAVTLAKMANIATDRLIGRDTAGTGVPEALTVGGGVEFTGSGIQTSAFTGDVTKSAGGTAQTIANDAVTFAKMQNTSAATRLLGRGSAAGAGDPEEVTLGAGLSMAGTVLSSTVVGTGGGDFIGPGSAVNNNIVVYDGTTGKLGKDGGQTIAEVIAASGGAYLGAQVTKVANETTANYTAGAVVAWDSEVYDTSAFHDNVTNNSRLTIPSGVTKVNISAGLNVTSLTASQWVIFNLRKNGSEAFIGGQGNLVQTGLTAAYVGFAQFGLPVTAGDYFECFIQIQTDTSVTIVAGQSNFTVQKAE